MFRNSVAAFLMAQAAFAALSRSMSEATVRGAELGMKLREIREGGFGRRGKYRGAGKPKRLDPNGLTARTIRAQRGFTTWQLERLQEEFRRPTTAATLGYDWPSFLDSRRDDKPMRHREIIAALRKPVTA